MYDARARFAHTALTSQAKNEGIFQHVTLKSIAQNTNLDPIFSKHDGGLEKAIGACNAALRLVTPDLRSRLTTKLLEKQKAEGKRALTEADRRRWDLPKSGDKWQHWEVPFDTDPDWPSRLREAVSEYRTVWRTRMDEINCCRSLKTDQECSTKIDQG